MLRNEYRAFYVTSNKLPNQNKAFGQRLFNSEEDALESSPLQSNMNSNHEESEDDDELSEEWQSVDGGDNRCHQNLKIGLQDNAQFFLPETLLSKELDKKYELRLNEKQRRMYTA